ncbi:hypothetical protein [Prevotella melaninogenica]|jgi:hypothetical protein|uniref:hypothetical protein n=1 Tax=Prevotella melaninogenica TaxID=28132 RepID=UPI00243228C5|nr:hypothetical protein [Prevotella melaninogenica]
MEKERKTKKRKRIILQIVMWTCILISVGTCTRYILWVLPRRPKPNNQPKYSSKEESYFKELEKRNNWKNPDRYIYNINGKGEPLPNDSVFLNKDYTYSLGIKIEDSTTFFSLPTKIEDTIALYLYNHVVERTPELQKIKIIFNYEEDLDERASIGHSRKSEYAVRGKKLVKLKHDME